MWSAWICWTLLVVLFGWAWTASFDGAADCVYDSRLNIELCLLRGAVYIGDCTYSPPPVDRFRKYMSASPSAVEFPLFRLPLLIPMLALAGIGPACACLSVAFSLSGKRRRRRTGCCTQCGYDLRGSLGGVCPECGASQR